jgi:uncharacterized protein (DUF58 family)
MRLTRRGWTTLGIALAALLLAWAFGSRSLNAVAAPALVALLASAIQLRFAIDPTVTRSTVDPGFPGETRTVTLELDGSRGTILRISDSLGDGLEADEEVVVATPPATRTYELTLARRGRHALGPTVVEVRDALGLFSRRLPVATSATAVVYPTVYAVTSGEALTRIVGVTTSPERQEFDQLREYVPGDPLRDVHWASSAKRDRDLFVKEFVEQRPQDTVRIVASAEDGHADAMASAVASLGLFALEAGLDVAVTTPSGHLEAGRGDDDQDALLAALADAESGTPDRSGEAADVVVSATADGVDVTIDGISYAFAELTAGETNPFVSRVAADPPVAGPVANDGGRETPDQGIETGGGRS